MNCLQTVQNIRVSGVRRDRQNSVVLRPSSVSVLYKSKRSSAWNSRLSVSVKAMSAGMFDSSAWSGRFCASRLCCPIACIDFQFGS